MSMISSKAWTHRSREKSSNWGKNKGEATTLPSQPQVSQATAVCAGLLLLPPATGCRLAPSPCGSEFPIPRTSSLQGKPTMPGRGIRGTHEQVVGLVCATGPLFPPTQLLSGHGPYLTDSCEYGRVGYHLEGETRQSDRHPLEGQTLMRKSNATALNRQPLLEASSAHEETHNYAICCLCSCFYQTH